MLIGGDDISNDVISHYPWHVFFNMGLHSRSFPLLADWRKSDSSVDGESQGNWRWNLNSRDVVASSHSFYKIPKPGNQALLTLVFDKISVACPDVWKTHFLIYS